MIRPVQRNIVLPWLPDDLWRLIGDACDDPEDALALSLVARRFWDWEKARRRCVIWRFDAVTSDHRWKAHDVPVRLTLAPGDHEVIVWPRDRVLVYVRHNVDHRCYRLVAGIETDFIVARQPHSDNWSFTRHSEAQHIGFDFRSRAALKEDERKRMEEAMEALGKRRKQEKVWGLFAD